jgi:hypothetical protein
MCRLTTVMAKYRDWSIDGKPLGTARGVIDEKNTRTDYTSTESSQDYYFLEFFNTQYFHIIGLLLEPSGHARGEYVRSGILRTIGTDTGRGGMEVIQAAFANQKIESTMYEEMDENRNYTIKII